MQSWAGLFSITETSITRRKKVGYAFTCMKVVLPDPAIPMHRMVVGCFSLGAVIGSLDDMTYCCKETNVGWHFG